MGLQSTSGETKERGSGKAPPPVEVREHWHFNESRKAGKPLIFIFGESKIGKSSLALSKAYSGDKIMSLSFDTMTAENLEDDELFPDASGIHNWNVVENYRSDPEEQWCESAQETFDYAIWLLHKIKEEHQNRDWVLLDGYDALSEIVMLRAKIRYGIESWKQVPEMHLAYWNERNRLLRMILDAASATAEKGMLVTTYIYSNKKMHDGAVVSTEERPKWSDWMEKRCQVAIKVYNIWNPRKVAFDYRALVYSSKGAFKKLWPTGVLYDITGPENLKLFWEGTAPRIRDPNDARQVDEGMKGKPGGLKA